MLPVTRFAAEMGDGNDKDKILLDGVKNGVRKYTCQTPAHILVEAPITQWVLQD